MDEGTWDFTALVDTHVAADRSTRARVRRVIDSILRDPGGSHEVTRLAERAAMSRRTLSRAFRRETGTTPARFVERARLALAQALLERSGFRIDGVAERSGFRNAGRMRRAFRRGLGVSPAGLRRAVLDSPYSGCGTMRR